MNEAPTTGPMPETKKRPHDFKYFDPLMESLQNWRSADHEDAITLSRNQVIEIIEGVKALRTPPAHS